MQPEGRVDVLTVGDLFAGAGGLATGFHLAGCRTLFFNEIDAVAAGTLSHNFPEAAKFVEPIQELTAARIAGAVDTHGLDVMVGGPPCQGFSINAPIRSNDDPRNHLFKHYVRLVLEGVRPKFIVLENVPGLVSMNSGRTLADVQRAFEGAGYRVAVKVLNAAHYGVPQERWRLILLGTRVPGIELSFPAPTHYSLQRANFSGGRTHTFSHAVGRPAQGDLFGVGLLPPTTVKDAIGDLPSIASGGGDDESTYVQRPRSEYQATMRDGASRLWNHHCSGLSGINLERFEHIRPGGSWRDIPEHLLPEGMKRAHRSDHTKRYGRLHPDQPSGTIMTKCDPHWGTVVHYAQDRIISVREAARLQSFPDWFRFTGSKGDQYRQVGNAVPPLLAKAIATHIQLLLRKGKRSSKEAQNGARAGE